ncbi:hypothetical protein ACLKA7_015069 [Drosophila subpalustris]
MSSFEGSTGTLRCRITRLIDFLMPLSSGVASRPPTQTQPTQNRPRQRNFQMKAPYSLKYMHIRIHNYFAIATTVLYVCQANVSKFFQPQIDFCRSSCSKST